MMNEEKIKAMCMRVKDTLRDYVTGTAAHGLINDNTIISGGALVSLLTGQKVNDWDIYFRTQECAAAVARVMLNSAVHLQNYNVMAGESVLDNSVVEIQDDGRITISNLATYGVRCRAPVMFFSKNACSLMMTNGLKLQPIWRFYGEPADIHSTYDYEHCTPYWSSWDNNFVVPEPAAKCLLTKTLKYRCNVYPFSSLIRAHKYMQRGYTISAGELAKIAVKISEIDFTDLSQMREQFMGVDQEEFQAVLDELALAEWMDESRTITLDDVYDVIDRVFNRVDGSLAEDVGVADEPNIYEPQAYLTNRVNARTAMRGPVMAQEI